jgi:hypothetical protein
MPRLTPGYSGKSLSAKLGVADGTTVTTIGAPPDYMELLMPPAGARLISRLSPGARFVHVFSKSRSDLGAALARVRQAMAPDGVLWVSWPKKASGVKTDITEDTIRELAFPLDLVDIKVCSVSEVWSGLKLMIRKERRAPAVSRT